MHFRVRVEREPFADEGQPIREIECAKACAGIIAAVFGVATGRRQADKTLQKSVNGYGRVSLAAPDHRALKAEFQIFRGSEADLLNVYPGIAWIDYVGQIEIQAAGIDRIGHIGMPMKPTDQEVVAERPCNPGEQWNVQRLDAIDAEGVDILGVVGVGHPAA